jgi:hypothetical protein
MRVPEWVNAMYQYKPDVLIRSRAAKAFKQGKLDSGT